MRKRYTLWFGLLMMAILFSCSNMRQNVTLRKFFIPPEPQESDNIICDAGTDGEWTQYDLEKKTRVYCLQEPFDLIFEFIAKKKGFSSIRINSYRVEYDDNLLKEVDTQFKPVINKFEFDSKSSKDSTYIIIKNAVNRYNPFKCTIQTTIIDDNGDETNESFELKFKTGYKGERTYSILDMLSSV